MLTQLAKDPTLRATDVKEEHLNWKSEDFSSNSSSDSSSVTLNRVLCFSLSLVKVGGSD